MIRGRQSHEGREFGAKIAKPDEAIVLACDRHRPSADRVCALADKSGFCSPISADIVECIVPGASRATMQGTLAGK